MKEQIKIETLHLKNSNECHGYFRVIKSFQSISNVFSGAGQFLRRASLPNLIEFELDVELQQQMRAQISTKLFYRYRAKTYLGDRSGKWCLRVSQRIFSSSLEGW